MKISRRALLTSAGLTLAMPALAAQTSAKPLYNMSSAPVAARVRDLLKRMTLEEKVAQLCCLWMRKSSITESGTNVFSPEKAQQAIPHGIGQIGRPSDLAGSSRFPKVSFREREDTVNFVNAVQKYAVERTRLGFPVLWCSTQK